MKGGQKTMPAKAEFYRQMAEQVSTQLVGSWKAVSYTHLAVAQGTEELPAEDATNDSNVVVEETEDLSLIHI